MAACMRVPVADIVAGATSITQPNSLWAAVALGVFALVTAEFLRAGLLTPIGPETLRAAIALLGRPAWQVPCSDLLRYYRKPLEIDFGSRRQLAQSRSYAQRVKHSC